MYISTWTRYVWTVEVRLNRDQFVFPFEAVVLRSSEETSISVSKQKDTVSFKHSITFCSVCAKFLLFVCSSSLYFFKFEAFLHFFFNFSPILHFYKIEKEKKGKNSSKFLFCRNSCTANESPNSYIA